MQNRGAMHIAHPSYQSIHRNNFKMSSKHKTSQIIHGMLLDVAEL